MRFFATRDASSNPRKASTRDVSEKLLSASRQLVSAITSLGHKKPAMMKRESLVVLDWDDTLLCTSFLKQCGVLHTPDFDLNFSLRLMMARIDSLAVSLLLRARAMGHVVIVTNARKGWVEESASMWLPKLCQLLPEIEVRSARRWSGIVAADPAKWKELEFRDLLRHAKHSRDVVSVGDQEWDLDAARVAARADDRVETVKFPERPHPEEMIDGLRTVLSILWSDKSDEEVASI